MGRINLLREGVSVRDAILPLIPTIETRRGLGNLHMVTEATSKRSEEHIFAEEDFKIIKLEVEESYPEYGYEVWLTTCKAMQQDKTVEHKPTRMAYNMEGKFIGTPEMAEFLCQQQGLRVTTYDENDICSIGFNPKTQEWFGWSHRAMSPGFKVGSCVDSTDHLCAFSGWTSAYLKEHPEKDKRLPVGFTAKTFEDAKLMAIAYADAVA